MIPPKKLTKTILNTLVLVFLITTIQIIGAEEISSSNESSYEQRKLPGEIHEADNEEIKLVTNSLVPDTTQNPEDSSPLSSSNEEIDSIKFAREMDDDNSTEEQDKPASRNDTTSSTSSFVSFPTGPESFEGTAPAESELPSIEEIFGASSQETDETSSMFSTSGVFSRLASSGDETEDVPNSREHFNTHETYKPRGQYNSHERQHQNSKENYYREDNLRQRIMQSSNDSSSEFKSRSDVVDSHNTDSTTTRSAVTKQKTGKTIKTYKSSADAVLRQFVENGYLRHPLACIVDTTDSNLKKAQILWNATLRSNAPLDMVLSGYNSTGKTNPLKKCSKNN